MPPPRAQTIVVIEDTIDAMAALYYFTNANVENASQVIQSIRFAPAVCHQRDSQIIIGETAKRPADTVIN